MLPNVHKHTTFVHHACSFLGVFLMRIKCNGGREEKNVTPYLDVITLESTWDPKLFSAQHFIIAIFQVLLLNRKVYKQLHGQLLSRQAKHTKAHEAL